MTDRAAALDWIRRYLVAWDSNDPDDITALFTPDAAYRFHPYDEPEVGHDAIVEAWRDGADEPGDHEFDHTVLAVDGDVVVVRGHTVYTDGDEWENLWIIELEPDGRASAFTEWYLASPDADAGDEA